MTTCSEHPDAAQHFGGSVEFDLASVERALGELPDDDRNGAFADALGILLEWMTEPLASANYAHTPKHKRMHLAGRRAAVCAWCLRPESFPQVTLQRLSDDLGIKPERLHELSADFSRKFGIKNRLQISRAPSVAARKNR